MELSATEKRNRPVRPEGRRVFHPSLRSLSPLILVSALALSGCGDKPPQPAAAAPPPVTVAQPVKRTVTDWDEFTGRFEALEEVQVRARVGGFVNTRRIPRWRHRARRRSALHRSIPAPLKRSPRRPTASSRMRAPKSSLPSANSIAR